MMQKRAHRAGIHDPEVLVAVVEDDIGTFDARLIQLSEAVRNRLKLTFRK
jgi:hypothetical protein